MSATGNLIRRARESKRLSVQDLASRVGIPVSTMAGLEAGRNFGCRLNAIAVALEIDEHELSVAKAADHILHILQHALGRDRYGKNRDGREDYRNHFCAGVGSADFTACRDAVAQGLMVEHPPSAISGGDYIFTVTDAGKAYVAAKSPPEPKLTRGQLRYREWLGSAASECGVSFGEWLRSRAGVSFGEWLRSRAGERRNQR